MKYFGQNPTVNASVFEVLTPLISQQPQLHWAVLLDTAFDHLEADPADAPLPDAAGWLNCYAPFAELKVLAEIAPHLVPIAPNKLGASQLTALLTHASGRPMLSVVASSVPLPQLVGYWRTRHWLHHDLSVRSDKGLLRFADTRTLAYLPQILSAPAWAAVHGPLAHWFFVNRKGELEALPAPAKEAVAESVAKPAMRLIPPAKGWTRMSQEADIEALLQHLHTERPQALAAYLPHTAYQGVRSVYAHAQAQGTHQFADQLALALDALSSKGASLTAP